MNFKKHSVDILLNHYVYHPIKLLHPISSHKNEWKEHRWGVATMDLVLIDYGRGVAGAVRTRTNVAAVAAIESAVILSRSIAAV